MNIGVHAMSVKKHLPFSSTQINKKERVIFLLYHPVWLKCKWYVWPCLLNSPKDFRIYSSWFLYLQVVKSILLKTFIEKKMSFRGLCSIWIKSKTFVIYIIPSVTYDKNDTQNKHFLIEFLQFIYSFIQSTENLNNYRI